MLVVAEPYGVDVTALPELEDELVLARVRVAGDERRERRDGTRRDEAENALAGNHAERFGRHPIRGIGCVDGHELGLRSYRGFGGKDSSERS